MECIVLLVDDETEAGKGPVGHPGLVLGRMFPRSERSYLKLFTFCSQNLLLMFCRTAICGPAIKRSLPDF